MKVKILGNPITPYGSFSQGQILTDEKIPTKFLIHLVEAAGAAEYLDKAAYETKIVDVDIKKKPPSSPLSQPDRVSHRKILSLRKKKQMS